MLINKLISLFFRTIILSMIVANYIYLVCFVWLPDIPYSKLSWIVIFLFHLILIMTIWSLFVAGSSDPGQVPLYWGFYLGDTDFKRRRYCLMCNVFKPERTHHCSICNRCVLNMDHHCPWINNCIGFFNRKFFLQMLFYLNLCLFYVLIVNSKFTYDLLIRIANSDNFTFELRHNIWFLFIYATDVTALIITSLFFRLHLTLAIENKTTIETIERKGEAFESEFSGGKYYNWIQVMGTNKFLWFFPLKTYTGSAKGNGIDWNEENKGEQALIERSGNIDSNFGVYPSNELGNKFDTNATNQPTRKNENQNNIGRNLNTVMEVAKIPKQATNDAVSDNASSNVNYPNSQNNNSSRIEMIPKGSDILRTPPITARAAEI